MFYLVVLTFSPLLLLLLWWAVVVLTRGFIWLTSVLAWSLMVPFLPSRVETRHVLAPAYYGVQADECGQPFGYGQEGEARAVPLSSHLCGRLRRRARWVRSLECYLGSAPGCVSALVRGRWTPDLTSPARSAAGNLLLSHLEDGVRILGGGSVPCERQKNDDGQTYEGYLVVELSDGSLELVFPELLFHLVSYAFLRERDAVLVSALRLRALDWCKKVGLSQTHKWLAVPSAIHLAWQVSPVEVKARQRLGPGPSPPLWWGSA